MRDEDIPDINNPKTITAVLEGDKLMKEVLNGGYNVQTRRDTRSIENSIRAAWKTSRLQRV